VTAKVWQVAQPLLSPPVSSRWRNPILTWPRDISDISGLVSWENKGGTPVLRGDLGGGVGVTSGYADLTWPSDTYICCTVQMSVEARYTTALITALPHSFVSVTPPLLVLHGDKAGLHGHSHKPLDTPT
jgi:hypothetical protein